MLTQNKLVTCFSDRKLTRKTINRPTFRSPKSSSSPNYDNGFFVKNITKKFLAIESNQKKLYTHIRIQPDLSQQGQKDQYVQRSKSENQLNRVNKKRQKTLKEKSPNQLSQQLNIDAKSQNSLIQGKNDRTIEQLKQQNNQLRQRLDSINKRLQSSLKGKYQSRVQNILNQSLSSNRFVNVANKIKDNRIQELEKLNHQLTQEIKLLKRQLKIQMNQQWKSDLKRQIKSQKNLPSIIQFQKVKKKEQAKNIQNKYIQLKSYVLDLESKYIILREQNQKMKIEIDCIKRKSYSQIENLKKTNMKEITSIKDRYFKLLGQHKDLTKQNYDLALKFKKLSKQIIVKHIDNKLLQTSLTLSQSSQYARRE